MTSKPSGKKSSKKTNYNNFEPDLDNIQFKKLNFTDSQKEFQKKIHENQIIVCQGPAGTSKTFTAMQAALQLMLNPENNFYKIVLTKPIEESGEKLGSLPGAVDEKIEPYMASFFDNGEKIIGGENFGSLMNMNKIEFKPLAYLRGRTFDNTIMILDEAQNCDFRQLILYVTRMGRGSKVIIMGDVSQYDIKKNKIALPAFVQMLAGIKDVIAHNFTREDIVRSKILVQITDRYEQWKAENKITDSKN